MPETDFPCCETKPATKTPEWHQDRVRQAVNEYDLEMALAADLRRIATRDTDAAFASVARRLADEAHKRAHDAVLQAAEAVKQERGS